MKCPAVPPMCPSNRPCPCPDNSTIPATERGGHVRKGEHGTRVVFWKIGTRETEDADGGTVERKSILLRYYTLFNVEQCEGVVSPESVRTVNPIEQCERIVSAMPTPPAMEQDARAWYR